MPTFTKTTDNSGYITVSEPFTTGDTVTITVFDVSVGTTSTLVDDSCTESSGIFTWDFFQLENNVIVPGAYSYIMTNQQGVKHSGDVRILPVGGIIVPVYSTLSVQLYEYDAILGANTTNGISDAYVYIYDSQGVTQIKQGVVSATGSFTCALVDGTYIVRANKAGVSFIEETITITNTSNATPSQIIYGTLQAVPALTTVPNTCRVYEYCFDIDSTTVLPTVTASAQIQDQVSNLYGRVHSKNTETGIYDSITGMVYWDFVWGATVQFSIIEVGIDKTVLIPESVTQRLIDL